MSVRMTNRFRGGSAAFVAHRLLGASLFAALTAAPALAPSAKPRAGPRAANIASVAIITAANLAEANLNS